VGNNSIHHFRAQRGERSEYLDSPGSTEGCQLRKERANITLVTGIRPPTSDLRPLPSERLKKHCIHSERGFLGSGEALAKWQNLGDSLSASP
jgi:hypothetical protein